MKGLSFFLLPALVRLCYANVHGVICRQKHFELPSNLQNCNMITGGLIVDGYSGVFSLPNLWMVDSISFQSGNITEISLPNLVTATQFLTFWGLPQLTKIDLPNLVSGKPAMLLAWLPRLSSFHLPELVTSSSIKVMSTPSLRELVLPSLARIKDGKFSGYFQAENGPRHLSLPALKEVDGTFNVTGRVDTIKLASAPKVFHNVLFASSANLDCTSLEETWARTEKALGDFQCQSLQSIIYGNQPMMPVNNPPPWKSILRGLIMTAILIFISVAFWGGSRWDLWFILSMYVGVWSLVGSHLDIRSGWLAPLLQI